MKIYYMVVFAAMLMVLFNMAGFDTSSSWIYDKLGMDEPENFQNSTFWVALVGMFGAVSLVGARIGSLVSGLSTIYVLKAIWIISILVFLVFDIINIIFLADGWVRALLTLIILPIGAGFWVALEEFWEGRD